MTINYTEKRGFMRMKTDSPLQYKIAGSDTYSQGHCINLSASGVLFSSDQRIKPGTVMDIKIDIKRSLVPPLYATVEVVRSQCLSSGGYQIGVEIIPTS